MDASELVDVRAVGRLLKCSTRHVWGLVATGRMPEPIRLGRCVRWRSADLGLWVRRGCPNQEAFEVERAAAEVAK